MQQQLDCVQIIRVIVHRPPVSVSAALVSGTGRMIRREVYLDLAAFVACNLMLPSSRLRVLSERAVHYPAPTHVLQ